MPRETKPILTVAQVLELQPGTEKHPSWVNPGFEGLVEAIVEDHGRYICSVSDQHNPQVAVYVTYFEAPRFAEGDVIKVEGALRRTEFRGKQQVAISRKTITNIVRKGAGTSAPPPTPGSQQPQDPPPRSNPPAPRPSLPSSGTINGQTVGMAVKEAIGLVSSAQGFDIGTLSDPQFWVSIRTVASDIIRVSQSLERGELLSLQPTQTPPPRKPTHQQDEDVPF